MKAKSHFHTQNHIKELREKRGWSSRELARRMGASAMHMGRLESGKTPLTKDWILKLAAALDVDSHKVANLPMEKELPKGHDDTLLGCAIGWLLESADKQKVTLSREELSKWAGHVYNEALKQKLNYQQTRYLAETIILVLESTRKEKKAGRSRILLFDLWLQSCVLVLVILPPQIAPQTLKQWGTLVGSQNHRLSKSPVK